MATGIVNLYTVMSPPATSGRTAVPQGSSVLWGSGPSRWGHPFGSSLRAFVRTRSDRRFFPMWGWGALWLLIPAGFKAFAMGSPLRVELRAWARTRSDRRLSWAFDSKFLRDGVTLGGRVCVSLYVLDRNEGFNLVFSLCHIPSRWGYPFRVEYSYCLLPRSDRRKFLGEPTWRLVCLGSMFFLWLVQRWALLSSLSSLLLCVSVLILACCLAATPLPGLTHVTRQWTVFSWPHLLLCFVSMVFWHLVLWLYTLCLFGNRDR